MEFCLIRQGLEENGMFRHVPDFILAQLGAGKLQGDFEGYVLMLDIVEFTGIVEELQNQGLRGSDSIGSLLNQVLQEPIKSIYDHGGFVSLFVGDAVCAIFPGRDSSGLLAALSEIRKHQASPRKLSASVKTVHISLQEMISFGEIRWRIFPDKHQYEYLFFGPAIRQMADLSGIKKLNACSREALEKLGTENVDESGNLKLLKQSGGPEPNPVMNGDPAQNDEIKHLFVTESLRNLKTANEIRNLAACFVILDETDEQQQAITTLHKIAEAHFGFVNKIDATSTGLMVIVLFGVPLNYGCSVQQAAEFAMTLIREVKSASIGFSCGYAYAGYIGSDQIREYTALGHTMNIASRLSQYAGSGEIVCDQSVHKQLSQTYATQLLGSTKLKGIKHELSYYRVGKRRRVQELTYKHYFVGREKELEEIRQFFAQAGKSGQNAILYITADPGLGKSRLAWEYLQSQKGVHKLISLNRMENRRSLETIRQIVANYLHIDEEQDFRTQERRLQAECLSLSLEQRQRSSIQKALGMILEIPKYQSAWQDMLQLQKEQMLIKGFRAFISSLCRQKPVLLLIDDAQWVDPQSIPFLQALPQQTSYPLMIIATCRYLPDCSQVDLGLGSFIRRDLALANLPRRHEEALLRQIFKLKKDDEQIIPNVVARSGGNPLYLEQMAYSLLESGILDLKSELERKLDSFANFKLSDVFNGRIDRFSSFMQECLYGAAVFGMHFHIHILKKMMGKPIDKELQTGIRHRLWSRIGPNDYSFSHNMIRDTIYQRLSLRKLRHLHELAALTLQEFFQDRVDLYAQEIAYHFQKADCSDMAAKAYLRSAKYNYRYGNLQAAITYQRRAALHLGKHYGFKSSEHIQGLFWVGLYYHRGQLFDKAETIYHLVIKYKSGSLHPESSELSPYWNNLGRLYKDIGRWDEAEKLLRRSLAQECLDDPDFARTNVADRLSNLGSLYAKQKQWHRALAYFKKSLEFFEGSDHGLKDFLIALTKVNISDLYLQLNRYQDAESLVSEALTIYLKLIKIPNHYNTAKAFVILARSHHFQGQRELAEKEYLKARRIIYKFYRYKNHDYALINMYLGDLYQDQGLHEKARRYWKKAEKIFRSYYPAGHPQLNELSERPG